MICHRTTALMIALITAPAYAQQAPQLDHLEYPRGKEQTDLVPRPDPTLLTTAQLLREIGGLRELLSARLDGMDKAIRLLQANADKQPSTAEVNGAVDHLGVLLDEKEKSILQQFLQRDTAVGAALQAAEKAVAEQNTSNALAMTKSENAFEKRIEASDKRLDDVRERLTLIEGRTQGIGESWGVVLGALGAIGLLIGVAIAGITLLVRANLIKSAG